MPSRSVRPRSSERDQTSRSSPPRRSAPAALRAAERLQRTGTSVEVIDPRTLYPLDLDAILESVAKTSRLVIAHEAVQFCGIGAEIAAAVAEHGLLEPRCTDRPCRRAASARAEQEDLEQQTLPGVAEVIRAIENLSDLERPLRVVPPRPRASARSARRAIGGASGGGSSNGVQTSRIERAPRRSQSRRCWNRKLINLDAGPSRGPCGGDTAASRRFHRGLQSRYSGSNPLVAFLRCRADGASGRQRTFSSTTDDPSARLAPTANRVPPRPQALEPRVADTFDRERQEADSECQPDGRCLARDSDCAEDEGKAG